MGAEDMPQPEIKTIQEVVESVNDQVRELLEDDSLFVEKFEDAKAELNEAEESVTTKKIKESIIAGMFKLADSRITELNFASPDFKKYKDLELTALVLRIRKELTAQMTSKETERNQEDKPGDIPGEAGYFQKNKKKYFPGESSTYTERSVPNKDKE
jgi:hypothetical protein